LIARLQAWAQTIVIACIIAILAASALLVTGAWLNLPFAT
jgi:hypothetical protein